MDQDKYADKKINHIKESLTFQNLDKQIVPEILIKHRDRYFLIQCKIKNKTINCVFLRYDRWIFYIHGLKEIPRDFKRREYDNKFRVKANQNDKIKSKKKEITEKQIQIANKLLESLEKNKKVI